jgi:hypothetical protein
MGPDQMAVAEERLSPCLASFPRFLTGSQSNFTVEKVCSLSRKSRLFFYEARGRPRRSPDAMCSGAPAPSGRPAPDIVNTDQLCSAQHSRRYVV